MNGFCRRLTLAVLFVFVSVAVLATSASADRVPDPLSPKNWIGTWKIQATAAYSTCANVSAGDTAVMELTVSISKNQWSAREVNKTNGATTTLQGATQRSVPPILLFRHGSKVGLDLWLTALDRLEGRRVVANDPFGSDNACAIVYEVSGRRSR
jgi:hypothetical protein